jgi:hypothetical protein
MVKSTGLSKDDVVAALAPVVISIQDIREV